LQIAAQESRNFGFATQQRKAALQSLEIMPEPTMSAAVKLFLSIHAVGRA
jgi:hypothetical protein